MRCVTRVVPVHPDEPDPATLEDAARVLRNHGLVAFPTETVYGLGALAFEPAAVARIFEAKGRPPTNPLIVHVDGEAMARLCVDGWPEAAAMLAKEFWPGPLTLVLPRSEFIPDIVTGGGPTVGVRMPAPAVARGLITAAGSPLAAPSANRSNRISPTSADHVLADLDGEVEMILDGGSTNLGIESTVIDLADGRLRLLRPGVISPEWIGQVLGRDVEVVDAVDEPGSTSSSPGRLSLHYAPRVPCDRVEAGERAPWDEKVALILFGDDINRFVTFEMVAWLMEPESAARGLYTALRKLERIGLDSGRRCVVGMPPDVPEWRAIRDRLLRATRSAQG